MSTRRKNSSTNLLRVHLRALPIINVVLKIAITDAELEFVEKVFVVHQIECVEHIEVVLGE